MPLLGAVYQGDLTEARKDRDWDEALIEQGLREAIFVVDSQIYLSNLPQPVKDELWKYRQKWSRTLGLDKKDSPR